jgi:hypothetical protein
VCVSVAAPTDTSPSLLPELRFVAIAFNNACHDAIRRGRIYYYKGPCVEQSCINDHSPVGMQCLSGEVGTVVGRQNT